ncbi:hypothetical protein HOY82DRAFT_491946 [Tuber indicum]|nr:hypothetical protein HOY82DRAFT_491946 [Tuber indicum]
MARLDEIIPYTKYCPISRSVCKLKACEDEVDFLREKYTELPDNDGVELYDGSKIKLIGPDLGILVAKAEHRFPILQRHNEQLRSQGKREFAVKSTIIPSRLDWALFEACNTRMLGNRLTTSHIFRDEKVCGMGLLEPGATVWKTGRTTGQTKGKVNDVGVIIWKDGFTTEEVAVISSFSGSGSLFADNGDSGALVFCMANSLEAVGLVVGGSESQVPRWVAVTPLWAILEDMKLMTGMDIKFCTEC